MMQNYKVYAYCATFNHSNYIKDTLNGFCMQQTEFPFVCAIKDDASTDGEQEVIKQYLKENFNLNDKSVSFQKETEYGYVTYAQHKTNKNCFFAVVLLKENHYSQKKDPSPYFKEWRNVSEYIALCEGDDYWIDPLKLQKQVDWLDGHLEYSMCFSNAIERWENNNKIDTLFSSIEDRDYSGLEMYAEWIVPTASVMYRPKILKNDFYNKLVSDKRIYMGDTPLFMTCSKFGKVHGMSDVMALYRRNEGGVTMIQNYNQKYRLGQYYIALYDHFGESFKRMMKTKVTQLYIQTFIVSCMDRCDHIQWYFLWDSFKISAILTIKELTHHIVRFIKKRV